ncbi:motility protein A [Sphingobium sp. TomMM35A]
MIGLLAQLFDPLTLLIMIGGVGAVALFQNGGPAIGRGFAALVPLLRADPDKDQATARAALLKIDQVAQLRGLACTDRVKTANPFLAEAARRLANSERTEQFEIWAAQALADRARRHAGARNVWLSIADAAPALGMAGTILGLIGMFAAMDDPAALGPSMALALLTTLYGVVIANVIAAPIASRLADLSERELAWQKEAASRLVAIARRENVTTLRAAIREVA